MDRIRMFLHIKIIEVVFFVSSCLFNLNNTFVRLFMWMNRWIGFLIYELQTVFDMTFQNEENSFVCKFFFCFCFYRMRKNERQIWMVNLAAVALLSFAICMNTAAYTIVYNTVQLFDFLIVCLLLLNKNSEHC